MRVCITLYLPGPKDASRDDVCEEAGDAGQEMPPSLPDAPASCRIAL